MTTDNLKLQELVANQSQPHVPLNTNARMLDLLVLAQAIDFAPTEPVAPSNGDMYIASETATWTTPNALVLRLADAWVALPPRFGWTVYVQSFAEDYQYQNGSPPGWGVKTTGGGSALLSGLLDVSIPAPANNDVLSFQTSSNKWESVSIAGGSPIALDDLTDVAIGSPAPADGQVLTWNASLGKWVAGGSSSSENHTPDTHPSPADPGDDEFEVAAIDTAGTRFSGATPWTAFALSTGVATLSQGSCVFKPALTASRNTGGYSQPTAGTTFEYTMKMSIVNQGASSGAGIFFGVNNSSGKMLFAGFNQLASFVNRMTNATTLSSNVQFTSGVLVNLLLAISGAVSTGFYYLRAAYDGTNANFSVSLSGREGTFVQFYTEAVATHLAAAPNLVGFAVDNQSASQQTAMVIDWFRRTAHT